MAFEKKFLCQSLIYYGNLNLNCNSWWELNQTQGHDLADDLDSIFSGSRELVDDCIQDHYQENIVKLKFTETPRKTCSEWFAAKLQSTRKTKQFSPEFSHVRSIIFLHCTSKDP